MRYRMSGRQQARAGSFVYEADSEGVVQRSASGAWIDETRWVRLSLNGAEVDLSASSGFPQQLSLDPRFELPMPDISGLHPNLIGPVFDLMTFYVDLRPDLRSGQPLEPGVRASCWARMRSISS